MRGPVVSAIWLRQIFSRTDLYPGSGLLLHREEEGEESMLRETSLLLRRIVPLGIVVIIAVPVGILFLLFLSWLGGDPDPDTNT